MQKTPVLCVIGPTASGKTALSLRLARALGGEIVSMDSMQIYRRMDIGTAKPTPAERAEVVHHLIDIAEPTDSFSVAQYASVAEQTLHSVYARGALPILTGGTGFYLRALTDGLSLGGVQSDPELRATLRQTALEPDGKRILHERLRAVDPATADRLHENDVLRVSRALEVFELTGMPISAQRNAALERPFEFLMLATTMERSALYRRAEERVNAMLKQGLLNEVRALLDEGVPAQSQAMQGIGYKELIPVLHGETTLAEATALLKQNTRRYAKRQWTWFRAIPMAAWLDMGNPESEAQALRMAEAFWKEVRP